MQKLQPETISLKVHTVGMMDTASKEVKDKEQKEIMEQQIEKTRKKDKKKNKARGKGKVGREMENKTHVQHESMREKNKLLYKREYERAKQENQTLEHDIGFLDQIEEKFDPLVSFFKSSNKRKKD